MWKWIFKFNALPKRWIRVTAPVWAVLREKPAFLIRCGAMQRADMYTEMQRLVRDEGGVVVWAFANYVYGLEEAVGYEGEMAGNWEMDGGRAVERWWLG